jgi:hypothetical protein
MHASTEQLLFTLSVNSFEGAKKIFCADPASLLGTCRSKEALGFSADRVLIKQA